MNPLNSMNISLCDGYQPRNRQPMIPEAGHHHGWIDYLRASRPAGVIWNPDEVIPNK